MCSLLVPQRYKKGKMKKVTLDGNEIIVVNVVGNHYPVSRP